MLAVLWKRLFFCLALLLLVACTDDNAGTEPITASCTCSNREINQLNPPSRVVFLGNSLLMGNLTFGLSASDSTKDYFYRLDSAFRSYNPDCISHRIMAKQLENSTEDSSLTKELAENILPWIGDTTDLIIIQLGDNFNTSQELQRMPETLETLYDAICTHAHNAKVVWVGEWYATDYKQRILRRMAYFYGAQFIDISDLNTSENQGKVGDVYSHSDKRVQCIHYENYSVSGDSITVSFMENNEIYQSTVQMTEYHDYVDEGRIDIVGYQSIVTDEMAASHPNDEGFRLIAERILDSL